MFMGTHIKNVDAKGRVSVPVDFRNVLSEAKESAVVCFPAFVGECLEGAGQAYFEKMKAYIEDRDPYDEVRGAFEISIIADSFRLPIDREGRISPAQSFFDHADIEDQVAFVGLGEKFQMWHPGKYEEHRMMARELAKQNRGLLKPRKNPPPPDRSDREW